MEIEDPPLRMLCGNCLWEEVKRECVEASSELKQGKNGILITYK